jgi:hypothetical protein
LNLGTNNSLDEDKITANDIKKYFPRQQLLQRFEASQSHFHVPTFSTETLLLPYLHEVFPVNAMKAIYRGSGVMIALPV